MKVEPPRNMPRKGKGSKHTRKAGTSSITWGDIAYEEEMSGRWKPVHHGPVISVPNVPRGRFSTRSKSRSRSRSRSASRSPGGTRFGAVRDYNENAFTGDIRTEAGWEKVWDPLGDFGGPFKNSRGLTENPRYLSMLMDAYDVKTAKEALEMDRKARRAKRVAAKGKGNATRRNGRRSTRRS